jgi:hypothetical protein
MEAATRISGEPLTTAAVAEQLGVQVWEIRSCHYRKVVEPPAKIGPVFYWTPADVERHRLALIAEGYLPAPAPAGASLSSRSRT